MLRVNKHVLGIAQPRPLASRIFHRRVVRRGVHGEQRMRVSPYRRPVVAVHIGRRAFSSVQSTNALRNVECHAHSDVPPAKGLFDPKNDRDACGVGFIGELSKRPTRRCVDDALEMLRRMTHRGACGCEENSGRVATRHILSPEHTTNDSLL